MPTVDIQDIKARVAHHAKRGDVAYEVMLDVYAITDEITKLRLALSEVVAALGPDHICECDWPTDCGLPQEASHALELAKQALDRSEPYLRR